MRLKLKLWNRGFLIFATSSSQLSLSSPRHDSSFPYVPLPLCLLCFLISPVCVSCVVWVRRSFPDPPGSWFHSDYAQLPSIKLITQQYINPGSSLTHRQIVVSATVVVIASGLSRIPVILLNYLFMLFAQSLSLSPCLLACSPTNVQPLISPHRSFSFIHSAPEGSAIPGSTSYPPFSAFLPISPFKLTPEAVSVFRATLQNHNTHEIMKTLFRST